MKERFFDVLQRMDWLLAASIFLLTAFGLVSLASLSTTTPFPYFGRQLVWVALGVIAFFVTAVFDYRILRNYGGFLLLMYLFFIGLLVLLSIVGREIRGVVSWFRFGSFAVEPGEFIKIILILVLAKYFSRRHVEIYRLRHLIISGLYAGIPILLILIQPDLGTAIIVGMIWLAIVLSAGIKPKHLAIFLILVFCFSLFAWHFVLAPYQQARIVSFLNPWSDPLGRGYNAIQSMIAVGSGRIWGKGVGYGPQTHLHFLPEAATDFIYAASAEERGFVGVLFLLAVYGIFFWRLFRIGMRARDNFARLTILGISAVFFSQLMINAGMNMGMLPITGITLPFVSYGGSSMLTAMVLAGLAESITIRSLKSGSIGNSD